MRFVSHEGLPVPTHTRARKRRQHCEWKQSLVVRRMKKQIHVTKFGGYFLHVTLWVGKSALSCRLRIISQKRQSRLRSLEEAACKNRGFRHTRTRARARTHARAHAGKCVLSFRVGNISQKVQNRSRRFHVNTRASDKHTRDSRGCQLCYRLFSGT
jgi:hypothetical protein